MKSLQLSSGKSDAHRHGNSQGYQGYNNRSSARNSTGQGQSTAPLPTAPYGKEMMVHNPYLSGANIGNTSNLPNAYVPINTAYVPINTGIMPGGLPSGMPPMPNTTGMPMPGAMPSAMSPMPRRELWEPGREV